MGIFFDRFGLGFLGQDAETVMGFVRWVLRDAKTFVGYSGLPYLYGGFGWPEIMCRTGKTEDGNLQITGVDTHCSGTSFWNAVISSVDVRRKDADPMERRLLLTKPDGTGMAVVSVLMPDVLPCFSPGTPIRLQMIAFPADIRYYRNEKEYVEAQEATEEGEKLLLEDGVVFPTGLLHNSERRNNGEEDDDDLIDLMLIRGTVRKAERGRAELPSGENGETCVFDPFIDVYIDTQFGPLEIIHALKDVTEEEFRLIRPGAVVSCVAILSGDPATGEYGNGAVHDPEHHRALLAYTLEEGDPERLRSAMSDDCVWYSEANGKTLTGADAIIDHIRYVQENRKGKCAAVPATVTHGKDSGGTRRAGERCIAVFYDSGAVSLVFTDDVSGKLRAIRIMNADGMTFRVDRISYGFEEKFERKESPADASGKGNETMRPEKLNVTVTVMSSEPDMDDTFEEEFPLTEEESTAWRRALMTGNDLDKDDRTALLHRMQRVFDEKYGDEDGDLTVDVEFPEPWDAEPEDADVIAYLTELLRGNEAGIAGEVVDARESSYGGDLREEAFSIAVECGCEWYVQDHVDDVELDPCPGETSPYLSLAGTEGMKDLLLEMGATFSWMDYEGYSFAMETVNGSVLSFDDSFLEEVAEKVASSAGMTEEELADLIEENGEDTVLPGVLSEFSPGEVVEVLQMSGEDGILTCGSFGYMDSEDGWTIVRILELLGWTLTYEGDHAKHGGSGVCYIE